MSRDENYSAEQYYIDLSDSLAAMRSAKGFVYAVIAVMAAFTVIFNAIFCIYDVDGVLLDEENPTAVVTNVRNRDFRAGDVLLIEDDGKYVCLEMAEKREDSGGVYVIKENGKIFISEENIAGKAEFILFPLKRFGSDTHILCSIS